MEPIKSREDLKTNAYDHLYRPFELSAFHEMFYFNILNTNRISNNTPSGSFSGNIISMFNPLRAKKSSQSNFGYFKKAE
jgi:hypothetical protein